MGIHKRSRPLLKASHNRLKRQDSIGMPCLRLLKAGGLDMLGEVTTNVLPDKLLPISSVIECKNNELIV
jgi:hypothetical protein